MDDEEVAVPRGGFVPHMQSPAFSMAAASKSDNPRITRRDHGNWRAAIAVAMAEDTVAVATAVRVAPAKRPAVSKLSTSFALPTMLTVSAVMLGDMFSSPLLACNPEERVPSSSVDHLVSPVSRCTR